MADEEQVKLLKEKGVKAWNEWRRESRRTRPMLAAAELRWMDLSEANFRWADLRKADLQGANLHRANLREANLLGASLRGADLRQADLINAKLSLAQLHKANLMAAKLNLANLRRADLTEATLNQVQLIAANLTKTNFRQANLIETDLSEANLSDACLSESHLNRAEFRGTVLTGADFSGATIGFTRFGDVDFSRVKGLETVRHTGPSEIGISTIYRSQGKIPFEFLRGAGVPDNFIEYMHSLVGTAFEFYSCFISYSSKDQPFAERLHADLQNKGVRCWFAPHHGQAGQKLHLQIDEAIRLHEKLLLILSTDSMKSEWVKTEIKKAAKRQKQEKKDVLFPVSLVPFDELREWECFDSDLGKDLGAEIREYLIPDFSRWKEHDPYQKAFAKLLRDLRSGKTKTA